MIDRPDHLNSLVVALQCGITPIATLQFGYGGGKWRFAWEGINLNCHDDVAHHAPDPLDDEPAITGLHTLGVETSTHHPIPSPRSGDPLLHRITYRVVG